MGGVVQNCPQCCGWGSAGRCHSLGSDATLISQRSRYHPTPSLFWPSSGPVLAQFWHGFGPHLAPGQGRFRSSLSCYPAQSASPSEHMGKLPRTAPSALLSGSVYRHACAPHQIERRHVFCPQNKQSPFSFPLGVLLQEG